MQQIDTINPHVWMCWFQGLNDNSLPELNQKCISAWQSNSDFDVHVLTNENIHNYVPEYFEITDRYLDLSKGSARCHAHNADLLRLLLLSKYGGTWVDSSVYPSLPFKNFYKTILPTDNPDCFFSYRYPTRRFSKREGDREISVWFLSSLFPKNYLIESWKNKLVHRFFNQKKWKYFEMDQILCEIYDSDSKIRKIINSMPQINPRSAHSLQRSDRHSWQERADSFVYKRPNYLPND